MIRVLIVEDSLVQRNLLKTLLESDPNIRVVGLAENGAEGVQMALSLKPDLITMDIRMPVMDGFEATRRIMQEQPTPIVVISSSVDAPDLVITFNAIKAGAIEVVEKPGGTNRGNLAEIRNRLIATVKGMATVKVDRRQRLPGQIVPPLPPLPRRDSFKPPTLIAIGASTGGPLALSTLFKSMPRDFPIPIVVVQHIALGFAEGFVQWLQTESNLRLTIAGNHQTVQSGTVYFPPDDCHLLFAQRGVLKTNQDPPVNYVRPSATVLFNSVAQFYGAQAAGVLLTGMGSDGAAGLQAMRQRGAITFAQDQATSVVYGMPKVAVELGAVDHVLPLEAIAPALTALTRA